MSELVPEAPVSTIINLTQACELFDIAEPTFRKLLRQDGFPVLEAGSNGVSYKFDAVAVKSWLDARAEREKQERENEKARLAQIGLDLFGGTVGDEEKLTLSPSDRLKLVQAEQAEVMLQQKLGTLVSRPAYTAMVVNALSALQQEFMALPDFVTREFSLDPGQRQRVVDKCEEILHRCAGRLKDPDTYGNSA